MELFFSRNEIIRVKAAVTLDITSPEFSFFFLASHSQNLKVLGIYNYSSKFFSMLSLLRKNNLVANVSTFGRMGSAGLKLHQLRQSSDKCAPPDPGSCGQQILKEYPCNLEPASQKRYQKPEKPKFQSMWNIKDCTAEVCVLDLRYDMKYYRISDKKKRKYQVTWNECPRLLIKPKKVCIREGMKRPEIKRRKRKPVPPGLAQPPPPLDCGDATKPTKCVYVVNPCCKVGRRPAKCEEAFLKKDCVKRRAPYPSFSECDKEPYNEAPPVECACLVTPALCDAWAILRKRLARGQPQAKKCGDA